MECPLVNRDFRLVVEQLRFVVAVPQMLGAWLRHSRPCSCMGHALRALVQLRSSPQRHLLCQPGAAACRGRSCDSGCAPCAVHPSPRAQTRTPGPPRDPQPPLPPPLPDPPPFPRRPPLRLRASTVSGVAITAATRPPSKNRRRFNTDSPDQARLVGRDPRRKTSRNSRLQPRKT